MCRNLRSSLPMLPSQLTPLNSHTVREKLKSRQLQKKQNFDKGSKALLPLRPKDRVQHKCESKWKPAIVAAKHVSPWSYVIKTTSGTWLRCNRRHLKKTLEPTTRVWKHISRRQWRWRMCAGAAHDNSCRFEQSVSVLPSSLMRQSRCGSRWGWQYLP